MTVGINGIDGIEVNVVIVIIEDRFVTVVQRSVCITYTCHPPGKNHGSTFFRVAISGRYD